MGRHHDPASDDPQAETDSPPATGAEPRTATTRTDAPDDSRGGGSDGGSSGSTASSTSSVSGPAIVLLVASAILVIAGLWVGLGPVHAQSGSHTSSSGIACGSAWAPNYGEADQKASIDRLRGTLVGGWSTGEDFRGQCEDAFGSRGVIAAVLIVIGGVAAVGGFVILSTRRTPGTAARGAS